MYIIKNAIKNITRGKVRNILIMLIVVVIAISACVALSIRQSAEKAKEISLDSMKITGQISIDRQSFLSNPDQTGDERIQSLQDMESLSLDEMQVYAESDFVDDFYYSLTTTLNADENVLPISTSDTTDNENSSMSPQGEGGRMGFAGLGNQGDFTVVGYGSHNAMTAFVNGTSKITEGTIFDEDTSEANIIISDELAVLNDLAVGDTITLDNPNDEDETYKMIISGIYNNSESSTIQSNSMQGFSSFTDPANQIYMSFNAIKEIIDNSQGNATVEIDETSGRELSTALRSQESGTYVFSNTQNFESFKTDAVSLGLDDSIYTISSPDLTSYEQGLLPLNNLSHYATYFLIVVLIIGGAILVVFNVFTIRERKYEIGVLAAIGMNKIKVASQFIFEIFIVTLIAITIGSFIGSIISVPIADELLENQITSVQASAETTNQNFGGRFGGNRQNAMSLDVEDYVSDISANVDMVVLIQLLGIGILLTLLSSITAVISILRYEPLKILSNRS
ncbi:MAG: ABC transporter permease [Eubacteriales bacterium]